MILCCIKTYFSFPDMTEQLTMDECESLMDVLSNNTLPIMVRVSQTCILQNEAILEEGQFVTVLRKKNIQLVYGRNWEGRPFRIYCNKRLLIDTIDEFYPTNREEFNSISSKITYAQIKRPYCHDFESFVEGDMFLIDLHNIKKDKISLISQRKEINICIPFEIMFDRTLFVFVKMKERITLQAVLRSFQPQVVQFVDGLFDKSLPSGNVRLENIFTYETIVTLTMKSSSDRLKYETYNLDSRIKVCLSNEVMPKQIRLLGESSSEAYRKKIEEIEFLTHYDIYAGRFYGSVELENPFSNEDRFLILNGIDGGIKTRYYSANATEEILKSQNNFVNQTLTKQWKSCESLEQALRHSPPIKRPSSLFSATHNKGDGQEWMNGRKKRKYGFKKLLHKLSSPTQEKYKPDCPESESPKIENEEVSGDTIITENKTTKELLEFQKILVNAAGEGDIADPQEIFRKQQEQLDRIKKKHISAEYSRVSLDLIKEHNDGNNAITFHSIDRKTTASTLRRENPLYGIESPTEESAKSPKENTLRSKPLSSPDMQRRKYSVPFANITSFNPQNVSSPRLSRSLNVEETPHQTIPTTNRIMMVENSTIPITVMGNSIIANDALNGVANSVDSGIDSPKDVLSPDVRNDYESVFLNFEYLNTSDKSQDVSKKKVLSESESFGHYEKRPPKILPKPTYKTKTDKKTKENVIDDDMREICDRSRSASNPIIDRVGLVAGESRIARPRSLIEKPFAEKPSMEKPLAEKPLGKKPCTEKPLTEKPLAEKPFAEGALTGRPLPDIPSPSFIIPTSFENESTDVTYEEIPPPTDDISQKRETESSRLIASFSIGQVGAMLKEIQLNRFVAEFRKQMVNGRLLLNIIGQPQFCRDLQLTHFEQRKLYKYIHGWRPNTSDLSRAQVEEANTDDWSIKNVFNQMKTINLRVFGTFCAEHQVDGNLLQDLLDNNVINTLRVDHGVHLSIVEYERLKGFVNKQIKYNSGERRRVYQSVIKHESPKK